MFVHKDFNVLNFTAFKTINLSEFIRKYRARLNPLYNTKGRCVFIGTYYKILYNTILILYIICVKNNAPGANTTNVSLGAHVRPRVAEGPEQGCVNPASGALTSGSLKAAMSSV